jgi:fructokinase
MFLKSAENRKKTVSNFVLRQPQVVDVTGAGDAFWAGFLFKFIKEEKIVVCVENGLQIAAKKIQKSGPLYD